MALNMGKQIGPLPAGAWIGVVGGGLVIAYFINKRQAAADSAATGGVSSLVDPDSDVGTGGGQFQYDPIDTVPTENPNSITDNTAWALKAKNHLVSLGYDGVNAGNAVEKYLAGLTLSANEQIMVNAAILRFGAPPEPISPIDDSPHPPTGPSTPATPATKPPNVAALRAQSLRRAVRFTWTYPNVPIGGFQISIKDLKTGKYLVRNKMIGAKTRVYQWNAPASRNAKTNGKVQIWIVPFKGGFTAKKVYGNGSGTSAAPRI